MSVTASGKQGPPKRDAKGRLLPGSTANPNGRPALPEWFRAKGEDALRYIVEVADGKHGTEGRQRAAEFIVKRVYGDAPIGASGAGESLFDRVLREIAGGLTEAATPTDEPEGEP